MEDNTAGTKDKAPKQIKLSKFTAQALQGTTRQVRQLFEKAKSAQEQFETAASIHREHLIALIQDADYKAEDFANYSIVEDGGEVYLRANPQQ